MDEKSSLSAFLQSASYVKNMNMTVNRFCMFLTYKNIIFTTVKNTPTHLHGFPPASRLNYFINMHYNVHNFVLLL